MKTPILMLTLLCGLMFGGGCTKNTHVDTARSARIGTIRAALVAATATEAAFHTWEHQHEEDIEKGASSRADADAKLLAFYSKRTKFNASIDALFAAMTVAALANADDTSLAAIVTAAKNVNDIVKDIETVEGKAGTP